MVDTLLPDVNAAEDLKQRKQRKKKRKLNEFDDLVAAEREEGQVPDDEIMKEVKKYKRLTQICRQSKGTTYADYEDTEGNIKAKRLIGRMM